MDTIFVVDDEEELCQTLKKVLEAEGYHVLFATDPEKFLAKIPNNRFSCCLLDLKLGNACGMETLAKIREQDPRLPVIMITAHETVKTAVEAMKQGAFHYLPKPFDNEELKALIARCVEVRRLHWELEEYKTRVGEKGVNLELEMGHSRHVKNLTGQVNAVAGTDVNVLLTGESGTGKELVARAIHQLSSRKKGPFVPVDCASIPETLIESELFGHEKGAFTGAIAAKPGKLEQANGGTLFLDEVSNIPLTVQAKLLRFLETRTVERVGGRRPITISVRVVAATNLELNDLVKKGLFRVDLFHRLNEFPIQLPTLRERPEDIAYLSLKFLHEFEGLVGKRVGGISPEALAAFETYPWPGNVRELRNSLKRAMVLANGRIEISDLPADIRNPSAAGIQTEVTIPLRENIPLLQMVKEVTRFVEKKRILDTLRHTEGRRRKAAEILEIDEKTLYNKLKEYEID